MQNASLRAIEFASWLPAEQRPEHTTGYEGFFHLTGMTGSVEEATLSYIIRDHDRKLFEEKKELLRTLVDKMNEAHPGCAHLELRDQYYNMCEVVEPQKHIVDLAFEAMTSVGVEPIVKPIRGGTDGARLSFMGLPCPNIFAAQANVEVAKAALATAELNYNSTKELFAKKVVSAFNLKTSENSYLTAKAQLAQAEAQEVNARNNLSYTEVKSPSDGVVGMLPYRAGALVSASIPQPLTTVSDNSNMYVYFSMTENQLLAMSRQYKSMDEALKNMPEVSLKLNDQSIYEQKGKIESISGVIDRKTGTVGVRAVFPNESRLLHSGASGNVLIPQTYKDCIVIPQGATVRLQDKTLVYKVVDGKAVSTLITVAEINDGREYIVLDGLKVGEEIVSEGAGLVREGTQVK